MDSFYTIVLSIAVIFLIILWIIVGILLNKTKNNVIFPPTKNTCPDYWTAEVNGNCVVSDLNKGTLYTDGNTITDSKIANLYNSNVKSFNFNDSGWGTLYGLSTACNLKRFANTYGISWDGVSNYNNC